jgi:serine/threonine protein kinase
MQKMLEENPQKRLSAEECLTHPYFKELQEKE